MKKEKFIDTPKNKAFFSEEFNYVFDKRDGRTVMWGKTYEDDPDVAPFPMLIDMEITERCHGICTKYGNGGGIDTVLKKENPCTSLCYKSNNPNVGEVMSFETAKKIIDKLPKQCTQIAFGTDASLVTNPEWYKIFCYARDNGIIPNVTVADITEETAKRIASVCGATSVSRYGDRDVCYNSVKYLTDAGLSQVNLHIVLYKNNMENVYETLEDIKNDHRLKKLNAIVFLSLKQKGYGVKQEPISQEEFSALIMKCKELGINFGMDSCSGRRFFNTIKGTEMENLGVYVTKCESSRESFYINAKGEGFPCSFTEGTKGWETGIDVVNCKDFIEDVWYNPRLHNFREILLMNDCNCPIYNV